ncbi:MAG: rRNA pseudouridine synthase, partial [Nitrospirae bacterium]
MGIGQAIGNRRSAMGKKKREVRFLEKEQGSSLSPIAHRPLPVAGVRLQKLIAGSGLASRRKAEEMIAAGLVTVNGRVVREFGTRVDPERDHVKVNGRHLQAVQPYVYLILNKPRNVMSSLDDPGGRPTVKHLLPGVSVRVFPVGRLDFDSEGLMLLTNHGDLAQALLHPRYHIP